MLSKLEQPGYDGLRDRWDTNCEQAEALMDRLEEDIRSVLEDSQANAMSVDERWTAVGPRDFLTGERMIWEQVARLDVPDAAALDEQGPRDRHRDHQEVRGGPQERGAATTRSSSRSSSRTSPPSPTRAKAFSPYTPSSRPSPPGWSSYS